MAHFIRANTAKSAWLSGPRAAVRVRVESHRPLVLQIDPDPEHPILILGPTEPIAYLPPGAVVLSPDGEVVAAIGEFAVTLSTFDPYHALTDLFRQGAQ